LRNMLGLLGWGKMLSGSGSFLMSPSKQALMSILKLDVILLVPGGQDATPDGYQILAGSRMQPASRQITVGWPTYL
jgi:hypothetical protein